MGSEEEERHRAGSEAEERHGGGQARGCWGSCGLRRRGIRWAQKDSRGMVVGKLEGAGDRSTVCPGRLALIPHVLLAWRTRVQRASRPSQTLELDAN